MQIILIRHLPTEWNKTGHLQGKKNIPISYRSLSEQKEKILENKKQLKRFEPFDCVFTSTLLRAQQTAFVYGFDHPVIEPLLDELDFGPFEGQPKQALIRRFSKDWITQPQNITLGEQMKAFENRVLTFIQRYRKAGRVLIFGHGSWIRALLSIRICGNIQMMNRVNVENNELVHVSVTPEEMKGGESEHERYSYL